MIHRIGKRTFNSQSGMAQAMNPPRVELKPLPYEMGDLEPVISGHQMEFHYGKHHRTYVNNLNNLQEQAAQALAKGDINKYVMLANGIKFNGGGHLNHEFFWETLAPIKAGGGALPDQGQELRTLIDNEWGSIEKFQEYFNTHTASLQGSGWGWLVYNKTSKLLEYRQTRNQDMPSDLNDDYAALLTIDIWEHAYYLDYKNLRPTFLKEMWKVIDWQKVSQRLEQAKQQ
jgi:superoxide dismutase, Fe-Mn family